MSIVLRVVLIVGSIMTTFYIMKKIRNSRAQIEDAIFWILLSFALILISIFPTIPVSISQILGMNAPVNFLFLFMIFVLLVKIFSMSLKISTLEHKIKNLTQEIAIRNKEMDESGQAKKSREGGYADESEK